MAEEEEDEARGCCGRLKERASEYPSAVPYIVGNEFCERFCYYGLRAVLVLYFKNQLEWTPERATVAYHAFVMAAYLTPLFGATLADSKFGKYKTIFWLSVVYVIGNVTLSVTSIPSLWDHGRPKWWGAALGLLLIAIGTGGIKPCVASFGGDQFDINQVHLLSGFFAIFYASINAGSLISILLTPKLRGDVGCFGSDECYPLAFGLPAILMVIALVLFFLGRKKYKRRRPDRNVILDVMKAYYTGLRYKLGACFGSTGVQHDHWLDSASKKLGAGFISDVKALNRVLLVFLPVPVFWTLYDQQGSRWTLQAAQMATFSMGPLGDFHPDQMQALNAILILLMIPLFQSGVYPLLAKLRIPPTQLQRMGLGMLLCAISFVVSGFVQLRIDNSIHVPSGSATIGQFRVINGDVGLMHVSTSPQQVFNTSLASGDATQFQPSALGNMLLVVNDKDGIEVNRTTINIGKNSVHSVVLTKSLGIISLTDDLTSVSSEKAHVRVVHAYAALGRVRIRSDEDSDVSFQLDPGQASTYEQGALDGAAHTFSVERVDNGQRVATLKITIRERAVSTLVLMPTTDGNAKLSRTTDVEASSVSILWQIPQYVLVTAGEIFFSITGLEFAYSEAPRSMKAVVQAAWLLTTAMGSLFVIIIAESSPFSRQSDEFFAYAGFLGLLLPVFTLIAWHFKYSHYDKTIDDVMESTLSDEQPLMISNVTEESTTV